MTVYNYYMHAHKWHRHHFLINKADVAVKLYAKLYCNVCVVCDTPLEQTQTQLDLSNFWVHSKEQLTAEVIACKAPIP